MKRAKKSIKTAKSKKSCITLQDGEVEKTAACGCRLVRNYRGGGPVVVLCDEHTGLMQIKSIAKPAHTPLRRGKAIVECITLAGYGHEHAALADCAEFNRPTVFAYRSALFPNCVDFGVDTEILSAQAVKLDQPPSPLYPWGVTLTVAVRGEKAAQWLQAFKDRIRGIKL